MLIGLEKPTLIDTFGFVAAVSLMTMQVKKTLGNDVCKFYVDIFSILETTF